MVEDTLVPFSEEEFTELIVRLDEEGDSSSELARACLTLMVLGSDYAQLAETTRAVYVAGTEACEQTAREACGIIGLKDRKKIERIVKRSAEIAAAIPFRADAIVNSYGEAEGESTVE